MGGHFGGAAIELGGIVVDPVAQGQRIGTRMVAEYMRQIGCNRITAYTRNPAIVKLVAAVCGEHRTYPLASTCAFREAAESMPHGTQGPDRVVYHVGRYAYGLYGGSDPADRACNGLPFKQRFIGLQDLSTALVVVADNTPTEAAE